MDLKGRVGIVTGAAGGLGRGIALEMAKEGMKLCLVDLNKSAMKPLVDDIRKLQTEALAIEADITSVEATERMAREAMDAFGQIDVLVNNAGIIIVAPILEHTVEDWDKVLNVNLKGAFLCCKAVAPHMIKRLNGRIINISSVAGKRGHPLVISYTVSKHGIIGLTQSLAMALGEYNITVNTVCPGFIDTNMWKNHLSPAFSADMGVQVDEVVTKYAENSTSLRRPQSPEDIGQAVVYLCKADNVSGASLTVDGGHICM